ncbi:PREDICTED: putative protein NRT1/ PTR FAMILY 2.14 [Tarenaya hassleriana]|uniref:putative protein NRT1/ PTR FAMILY 2.14 n=1 Tax=Tarenaya hassleriana TaxID=28532 RepID=UPI00053C8C6C|nr:PREDICTED: putative protein NRT1/ PTR FAMILY 2.14 [Tarenaya hassleriana]
MDEENGTPPKRKPVGWKAMPYILGNETLETLATFGLVSNFMVYLGREYHMDQVQAATLINTWTACTNLSPVVGAFISDSLVGKFPTIVFGCLAELLGMVILTLTALIPGLRPPPCTAVDECVGYTNGQMSILILGLSWLVIGSGGIRSCSVPFSIDQFDVSTQEGREGSRRFFSWYYTTRTIVLLISQTLVVYVQNDISWSIGFAIPSVLMVVAIVMFLSGSRFYVYVKPEGSVFSDVAQVFKSAYRRRKAAQISSELGDFCDPFLPKIQPSEELTDQFRFLNKAAIGRDNGDEGDGECREKWEVCSVKQTEDVKSIISIIPIFATSIIGFLAINQQQTFTVSQALEMDLHVPGTSYQVPASCITVISLITIGIWIPFYDAFLVHPLEKLTKQEGGMTLLQKVGIGNIFSIIAMLVSGVIEHMRRDSALGGSELSVFWLAPPQILMGFAQVFTFVGLIEFFNKQVPTRMRSIGNSLMWLALSASGYVSSMVVNVVHDVTGRDGGESWLTDDVNTSKLDYFYFFVAGVSTLNLIFYLFSAHRYRYRNM